MSHGRRHRPARKLTEQAVATGDDVASTETGSTEVPPAAPEPAPLAVAPDLTAGEVLSGVLEREAHRFLGHVGAWSDTALLAPTAADVHQARVALRRVRANLRTFGVLVDPTWSAAVRADAAWFGGVLGGVRNLDVLAERLWAQGTLLADEAEVRAVLAVLADQTAEARRALVAASRSERGERLVAALTSVGDLPLTERASQPTRMLSTLLERAWHDFRNVGRPARRHPTEQSLHRLRLRTKAFRYGCETVAAAVGKPAERTARAAARLQDRLGLLRDAAAAESWLVVVASTHPELTGAAERLAVVERAAAVVDRRGVGRDLREVEHRWRQWRH